MVRLIQQPTAGVDLLEQYRQSGSPDIFAQIMRAYGGMVLSVCYKVTKDAADAEDASQAVFLTLAVQCKTGSPIQFLGPWLKKVAKRTALDLIRSKKRRTRRETITAENRPEHYNVRPGAAPEADELNQILRAELDELPSKYKMPLVLHYFGGLSHDQISKEMKCTTAALGVRLHRARKMLGKRLSARGISLEGSALAVALAAAVPTLFTDRFIQSTQAAVTGITFGRPVVMPPGMTASMAAGLPGALPDNFTAVLSLVQQVGHSMAKARLKLAAVAMACSISLLGGAAEAVRILPDSIRPNLDFLAPSQLIKNLLTPSLPPMRLDNSKPKTDSTIALSTESAVESKPTYTAPLTQPLVTVNQPVLALQWPPPVPTAASEKPAPVIIPSTLSLNTPPAPRQIAPVTLATTAAAVPMPTRSSTTSIGLHLTGSGGGSGSNESAPTKGTDTTLTSTGSNSGGSRGTPLAQPLPEGFASATQNVPPVRSVASFEASAVGGATSNHIPQRPRDVLGRPVGPVPLPTGDNAVAPDSFILHSGQTYINGDGRYTWSDPGAGIYAGGTNSADFTLSGLAPGPGALTVERLPVTTTLAPERPTGHHFVGIWSINSSLDYSSIRVLARYDMGFAESLGLDENILKLWVYSGDSWIRIMDDSFERDMTNHALSGKYDGEIQYFAVSAPEPTAAFSILVLGGGALLRRRRMKR